MEAYPIPNVATKRSQKAWLGFRRSGAHGRKRMEKTDTSIFTKQDHMPVSLRQGRPYDALNEAPRSKLRRIGAKLRRSSPRHLCRAKALATADHPCSPAESGTGYSGEDE